MSKLNDDLKAGGKKKEKALAWIESKSKMFLNQTEIASLALLSPSGLTEIFNRYPEAREAFLKGKSKTVESLASVAIEKAEAGDNQMLMFILKSQAGWRETQGVDHTTNGESIKTPIFKLVNIDGDEQ